jgi:hypothetical protein
MSEEQDSIVAALSENGILEVLRWMGDTAYKRVAADFDEDAGHDQTYIGTLGYIYLRDLADRVGTLERFSPPVDDSAPISIDLFQRGITSEAFEAMPVIPAGVMKRNNFNGSAGWSVPGVRWLLQSYTFGMVDKIKWSEKSHTKQAVASQTTGTERATLWTPADYGMEEIPATSLDDFEGITLVLGHSYNRDTGEFELYLGRSRLQSVNRDPWAWKIPIASGSFGSTAVRPGVRDLVLPGEAASQNVADVAVAIRKKATGTNSEQA